MTGFESAAPPATGPKMAPRRVPEGTDLGGGRRAVAQEPRGPVSTALTLTGKASSSPRGNGGILRFLIGMQRLSGPNVSAMDNDGPPGGSIGPRPRSRRIGDCGLRRGRPVPPQGDGRAPVVWRTTQSSAGRYVVEQGLAGRPRASGVGAASPGKAGEQRHRAGWSSQVPRDAAAGLG